MSQMYFDKPKIPLADPADQFDDIISFDQVKRKKEEQVTPGALKIWERVVPENFETKTKSKLFRMRSRVINQRVTMAMIVLEVTML